MLRLAIVNAVAAIFVLVTFITIILNISHRLDDMSARLQGIAISIREAK